MTEDPQVLAAAVAAIVTDTFARVQLATSDGHLTMVEVRAARRYIADGIRELKAVKQRCGYAIADIRTAARTQRTDIAGTGQVAGTLIGGGVRRAMSAGRGVARRRISELELEASQPYKEIARLADESILQLQRLRSAVDDAASMDDDDDDGDGDGDAVLPEANVVAAASAAWHPDPYGRYELRYWNGSQWTGHVSSGGVVGRDS